jgi:hypothetical protein
MAIQYYEEEVKSGLKDKRHLSAFLKGLIMQHLDVKKIDIAYVFCNDNYLLKKTSNS